MGTEPHGHGADGTEEPPRTPKTPAPSEPWPLHADVTGFTQLTLDAPGSTTIAVVGPNGAGKTTLLRALLGLTPRAHAVLRLGDSDVTALPRTAGASPGCPRTGRSSRT